MTKKQIADKFGVTPQWIERLCKTILVKGKDYVTIINERNSAQLVFYPSAVEKITARNTKPSGRPKKAP